MYYFSDILKQHKIYTKQDSINYAFIPTYM